MPGYGDPRDAIVSLWAQRENERVFLGSGAFISPRLVLTARHVVEQEKVIHVRLVDGYEKIEVVQVYPHETHDIALLDLGRDFPKQGLVLPDCSTSALEKQKVDLYGVNPDTHHRDECQGYTLGTWDDKKRCYLFDHAQRKGFSGGIVVLEKVVVGVIIERHTREQQGVMVPLSEVEPWFQTLRSRLKMPPVSSPPISQNRFTGHVREEIATLFELPQLQPLHKALPASATTRPENILVPPVGTFSIETSIKTLHKATQACLQRLAGKDKRAADECATEVARVLGWLVILAVSETWVEEKTRNMASAQHFQQLWNTAYVALPVTTEAGPEVIEARLSQRRATFTLNPDGTAVSSPNRMWLGALARGLQPADALLDVKRQIWKTIFKEDAPEPFPEDNLRETLAIRYEYGEESCYVLVPAHTNGPHTSSLLSLLRQDLPYLGIFQIGLDTGEQVLVINEMRLMVLIREFLLMLGRYR